MPDLQPSNPPPVYALLADEPNLAVETALLEALPDLEPDEQSAALDTLIIRSGDRGLAGLVGGFARFDPPLQERILARAQGLYAGARLAIADEHLEIRAGAVELIRRSGDCKLAYLLAEALRSATADPKTRERAAAALYDLTACYLARRAGAAGQPAVPPDLQQDGDYLARALGRAVETWELHFRPEALTAAMWMSAELEDILFDKAAAPRSRLGRALLERLYAPDDARLAGFALRALHSPLLRSEVARRIEAATHPEFLRGLLSESWLLADPRIGKACHRIRHLRCLDEGVLSLTDLSPLQLEGTVRLVAASGISSEAKVRLYGQLLSDAPRGSASSRWAALWKLAEIRNEAADALLQNLARRHDEALSAAAARELRRRGWAEDEAASCPIDPAAILAADQPLAFDDYWRVFDNLDDLTREPAGEALLRDCPDLAARLGARLASNRAGDRVKALRIVRALKLAKMVEERIYRLANDPDAVVRSLAVALLVHLDEATSRRILRRALEDPDARVQANSIEVLDQLGLPQPDRQLAAKLDAPHPRVRATAVAALLKLQIPEAAGALLEMLEASSRSQRISALWVIDRLQLGSLAHRLEDLSRHDPDSQVRQRAERVLREFPVPPAPFEEAAAVQDRE